MVTRTVILLALYIGLVSLSGCGGSTKHPSTATSAAGSVEPSVSNSDTDASEDLRFRSRSASESPPRWLEPPLEVEALAVESGPPLEKVLGVGASGRLSDRDINVLCVYRSQADRILPVLAQHLHTRQGQEAIIWLRPSAAKLLPIITPLYDDERQLGGRIVAPVLGKEALPLLPKLLVDLQSKRAAIPETARKTIAAIGSVSVPELLRVLPSGSRADRIAVLDALGAVGPDAELATDEIMKLSRLDDPLFYAAAVNSLAHIDPGNEELHERLVAGLKDAKIAKAAVAALSAIKQPIPAVAPVLATVRIAGDNEVPLMAMLTHLPLNGRSVEALLGCYDSGIKRQADILDGYVLPFLREVGDEARPVLVKHCGDAPGGAKAAAMRFARALDVVEAGAPLLQNLRVRTGNEVEVQIASQLRAPADALVALISPESNLDTRIRKTLASKIAWGAGDHIAQPALRFIQQANDPDEQMIAWMLLENVGPEAEPAIPVLSKQLERGVQELLALRGYSNTDQPIPLDVLMNIGRPAVPSLVAALQKEEDQYKPFVLSHLGAMGHEAESALPVIQEFADNGARGTALAALAAEQQILRAILPAQGLRRSKGVDGRRRTLDEMRQLIDSPVLLIGEIAQRWDPRYPLSVIAGERQILRELATGSGDKTPSSRLNPADVDGRVMAAIVLFASGDDSPEVIARLTAAVRNGPKTNPAATLEMLERYSARVKDRSRLRNIVEAAVPDFVERVKSRRSPNGLNLIIEAVPDVAATLSQIVDSDRIKRHSSVRDYGESSLLAMRVASTGFPLDQPSISLFFRERSRELIGPHAWELVPPLVRHLEGVPETYIAFNKTGDSGGVTSAMALWAITRDQRAIDHLLFMADTLTHEPTWSIERKYAMLLEVLLGLEELGVQGPQTIEYWKTALDSSSVEAAWLLWRLRPGEESANLIVQGLKLDAPLHWQDRGLLSDQFWDLLLAMGEHASHAIPFLRAAEQTFPAVKIRAEAHRILRHLEVLRLEGRI